MSEDRIRELGQGYAEDDYQGDESPDLGPLRALAERRDWRTRCRGSPTGTGGRCPQTIRGRLSRVRWRGR